MQRILKCYRSYLLISLLIGGWGAESAEVAEPAPTVDANQQLL